MNFAQPLIPATLIRRYKRFLADCRLQDGQEITAHCANPGSMMGLAEPGMKVWLEPNDDPKNSPETKSKVTDQEKFSHKHQLVTPKIHAHPTRM